MLDVRRLRLLRDLARLGTIAAVAETHTYTPSAVSQQLAALQREAGVALLERAGRGVTLTPTGESLVRHTEVILAALEAAEATLAAARGGLSGTVRIGAYPSAVRTLLLPALVALARDQPALDLMVTELDPVAVPAALRDRRLDVALVHDYDIVPVEPDPALDSTPLLDETVFIAVPAGTEHDPAGDPMRSVRDADWIVGSQGTLCHAVTLHACELAGFRPNVRHHADDFAAMLALVAAGQGVGLVPQLAVGQPPGGVRLVPLTVRRRTRIAYRKGAGDHPAVAATVAALRTAAATTPDETGRTTDGVRGGAIKGGAATGWTPQG
ncbi:LysR family transcriptional regulator [Micromonospora sp. WMMD1082]|uniref:LysR family transcriptional regulator n=1 Tax=Micromonospora sp. WMMD1082 TaxID=3016104 RepID=UPI0024167029|nr:LysR family transcriptional regulator [Micromonospora sp. WMMD1082]MDG4796304.1 LysR family transcriptional regulator [Micromonospora sp. WMMD1082]